MGSASRTYTDPAAYADAIAFDVPPRALRFTKRIYLDALSQLDALIREFTPVDTGYLLSSLTVVPAGSRAPQMRKRAKHARAGQYLGTSADGAARSLSVLAKAVEQLSPVAFVFRANYAIYVEDRAHMIARAAQRWRRIVRDAIRNGTP